MTVKRVQESTAASIVGFFFLREISYLRDCSSFVQIRVELIVKFPSAGFSANPHLNGAMSSGHSAHCDGTRLVVLTGLGAGDQDLIGKNW